MTEREREPEAPRTREPTTDEFGRDDPESIARMQRRLERQQRRKGGRPRRERTPRRSPLATLTALFQEMTGRLGGRGESGGTETPASPRTEQHPRPGAEPPAPPGGGGGGGGGPARPGRPRLPRRPSMPGGGSRTRLLVLGGAALLFIVFLIALFQPFKGEGSGTVIVQIPEGASAGEVGDILDSRGIVTSGTLFEIRLTVAGKRSDIQPGSYSLKQGMSYGAAIDQLTAPAGQRSIVLTIPEGYSRPQIAELAKQAGLEGDYLKVSEKQKGFNPGKYGAKGAKDLEGFLFPATYELERGASAKDLVTKQLDAFEQSIAQVNLKPAKSKQLTTYDVLTIASMVDREVQVAKERPLVAAVIRNRIKDGMPLGIDATVRFAVNNYTKPLTQSELNSNSPYNTRKFAGLPPGPIGSPGVASIDAAAQPVTVDYLFYVVKPGTCGEHTFASTEAEFERASKEYERARQQAGGQSPTSC